MDKQFEKRGLHNWRNLFKKPTLQDWIIFILLVLVLFLAWAYQTDIQACREFTTNNACVLCNSFLLTTPNLSMSMPTTLNISSFSDYGKEKV